MKGLQREEKSWEEGRKREGVREEKELGDLFRLPWFLCPA